MTAPKKAPCVDVRTDVHKDERFAVLGDLAGYNRYEAIGRMHALWSWCIDRGLQDAPEELDGYVVSEAVVRRFLGVQGIEAVLGGGCDDFALGVRLDDGRIYLRGTSEYVAAARSRIATAKAGGDARARGPRDQASGRYVVENTNTQLGPQPQSSWTPAVGQLTPASSSSSSSSPSPSPSGTETEQKKNSAAPSAGGQPRSKPPKSTATDAELQSVRVVLEKLSAQNGVRYSGTNEHTRLIVNHLRGGVTELDLRAVIGYCADELGWKSDAEMAKYLRPETLFGPKTIARYLDPARTWFEKLRSARAHTQRSHDERQAEGASA